LVSLPTPWWSAFADPTLDTLITTALTDNFTLAEARARVDGAQALLRQVGALRKPTVDLDAGVRREFEREVHRGRSEPRRPTAEGGDTDADAPPGDRSGADRAEASSGRNTWETVYGGGLTLRWELDLWGRLRSAARAESERAAAATEDYEALRLLISAQVADAYFQALEQRMQLRLLEEQRESAENFLVLIELRFLQGGTSSVDLLQQRGQVAEILAEVPVAHMRLEMLENRLDTLVGAMADGVPRTRDHAAGFPANERLSPMKVPAIHLAQRPDLRAAQRRVVAADYEVAVALAERLPRLTLDGTALLEAAGGTTTLSALGGLALFQPLLDWGRRRAVVDAAKAGFLERLYAYTDAYLIAVEEVESTLWQETQQHARVARLAERESILRRTLEQARHRYSQGVSDYLPVLAAQQDLQEVQRLLIAEKRALVSLRIQLFRAVGGTTSLPVPDDPEAVQTMAAESTR
jgi:NodT family efflux transporter outer membrane factor (OMF) lipoprotein